MALRGVLPGGGRLRGDGRSRAAAARARVGRGSRRMGAAPLRAARRRAGDRARAPVRVLERARLERPVPDAEAHRRGLPRRRVAPARHARARGARGRRGEDGRAAPDRLHAHRRGTGCRRLSRAGHDRGRRPRQSRPSLSVLPRAAAQCAGGDAGRSARLDGRMEVGRHPRAARRARRRGVAVVARRGSHHRALSRAPRARPRAAARHGDRRRGRGVARRPRAAVRRAADPDRPQDAVGEIPRAAAGGAHRLRPARVRRRRPARAAAARAPRAARAIGCQSQPSCARRCRRWSSATRGRPTRRCARSRASAASRASC